MSNVIVKENESLDSALRRFPKLRESVSSTDEVQYPVCLFRPGTCFVRVIGYL